MTARIALVLLAAGNSRRFGGDKLQTPIDGVPMLLHALRLYTEEPLQERFCARILVTQQSRKSLAEEAERLGYTVVWNDAPEDGISRSIRLGTEAAKRSDPDGVLYSVADQPYLKADTVRRILDTFAVTNTQIVAPSFEGKRGNPVVFPKTFLPDLCALSGDVGGNVIIKRHPECLHIVAATERELMDIDRNQGGIG
ncbi:MAG: nucleotidyltransferase family protein [Clostridia bacterium]|nr:nucleotidyltransferase family protein [Clostridia bacterium]